MTNRHEAESIAESIARVFLLSSNCRHKTACLKSLSAALYSGIHIDLDPLLKRLNGTIVFEWNLELVTLVVHASMHSPENAVNLWRLFILRDWSFLNEEDVSDDISLQ